MLDRRGPSWFDFARRVIIFGLGVYLLLYAVHTDGDATYVVAGLVLTSVIPIEDALRRWTARPGERTPTMTEPDETNDETVRREHTATERTDEASEVVTTPDDDDEDESPKE